MSTSKSCGKILDVPLDAGDEITLIVYVDGLRVPLTTRRRVDVAQTVRVEVEILRATAIAEYRRGAN